MKRRKNHHRESVANTISSKGFINSLIESSRVGGNEIDVVEQSRIDGATHSVDFSSSAIPVENDSPTSRNNSKDVLPWKVGSVYCFDALCFRVIDSIGIVALFRSRRC
jgi:hypothetical protein